MVSRSIIAGLVSGLVAGILPLATTFAGRIDKFSDSFEEVQVEQTRGHSASGAWIEKYPLLLTLRRETHSVGPTLSTNLTLSTNVTVSQVTNLSVSSNTNRSQTVSTNLVPLPPPAPTLAETTTAAAATTAATDGSTPESTNATTSAVVAIHPTGPAISTNVTVTRGLSTTLNETPGQTATLVNLQTSVNSQISVTESNLTITTADMETVVSETNRVVYAITNSVITPATHVATIEPARRVSDHLLIAEFVAPPDFSLENDAPAVLVLNNRRFGLAHASPSAAFQARRGFSSAVFRLPEEAFGELARATNARIRLKGEHGTLDRDLSDGCLRGLKELTLLAGMSAAAKP